MICMILNKNHADNHLYIADHFHNSQKIAESKELKIFFKKIIWFKTRHDALHAAANENPNNVYIDSDVGLKNLIEICKIKILSNNTEINVYEEGIGTYRVDLISSKIKKFLFTTIGAGCYFGGAFLTKKIHIFNPDLYKKNFPFLSKKAVGIEGDLAHWVAENKSELIKIFCPDFKIKNPKEAHMANLYLSDWNLDIEFIKEISLLGQLFVKPHPHVSEDALDQIPKNKTIELIPNSLPAEIVIILLLEKFDNVRVFHKNSSCITYFDESNIESIDISQSKYCNA